MNILELLSHHGVRLALSSVIMAFMLLNVSSVLPLSGLNRLENSTVNVQIPGWLRAHIASWMKTFIRTSHLAMGPQLTGRSLGFSQDAID